MRNLLLKCECCGGTGTRPMSGDLHETLEAVIHLKSAHSAQVVEAVGHNCKQEAMSNRLADLMRLGFLTRKRSGKFWVYSPNDQAHTQKGRERGPANTQD
jgi:hypothetical protein